MIDKKLIPVKGLKKEPFSGSHFGMRYYFCADDTKENFLVFVYPEPWSFEKTPDEQKTQNTFPITEDGMDAAISWLLEQYDARRDSGTLFPKTRCISSIRLPNSKKSISSFLYFHYI